MATDHEMRMEALRLFEENELLRELAIQYRDDMRHVPAPDSRERRIERINTVLGLKE